MNDTPGNMPGTNRFARPDAYRWENWVKRETTAAEAIDEIKPANEQDDDNFLRLTLYKLLLERLLDFARRQYAYFYFGFGGEAAGMSADAYQALSIDTSNSPSYYLKEILEKMNEEFRIIMSLVDLRTAEEQLTKKASLNLADDFGHLLLPMVKEKLTLIDGRIVETPGILSDAPLVISYFAANPNIRILPYANAVLIGIPESAIGLRSESGKLPQGEVPRDMLVMGHELGHYVYRNAVVNDDRLRDYLAKMVHDKEEFVQNWMEELFCDVYCALFVDEDELMALVEAWTADDPIQAGHRFGKHPFGRVRPFIYYAAIKIGRILAEGGEIDDQICADLPETYRRQRPGVPEKVHVIDEKGDQIELNLKEYVEPELCQIILELCRMLDPYRQEVMQLDEGERPFDRIFGGPRLGAILRKSPLPFAGGEDDIDLGWKSVGVKLRLEGRNDKNFLKIREETGFNEPIEPAIWKVVFHADGWIKEGPPAETNVTGHWEGTPTH